VVALKDYVNISWGRIDRFNDTECYELATGKCSLQVRFAIPGMNPINDGDMKYCQQLYMAMEIARLINDIDIPKEGETLVESYLDSRTNHDSFYSDTNYDSENKIYQKVLLIDSITKSVLLKFISVKLLKNELVYRYSKLGYSNSRFAREVHLPLLYSNGLGDGRHRACISLKKGSGKLWVSKK
jgi:hypothetical protein